MHINMHAHGKAFSAVVLVTKRGRATKRLIVLTCKRWMDISLMCLSAVQQQLTILSRYTNNRIVKCSASGCSKRSG